MCVCLYLHLPRGIWWWKQRKIQRKPLTWPRQRNIDNDKPWKRERRFCNVGLLKQIVVVVCFLKWTVCQQFAAGDVAELAADPRRRSRDAVASAAGRPLGLATMGRCLNVTQEVRRLKPRIASDAWKEEKRADGLEIAVGYSFSYLVTIRICPRPKAWQKQPRRRGSWEASLVYWPVYTTAWGNKERNKNKFLTHRLTLKKKINFANFFAKISPHIPDYSGGGHVRHHRSWPHSLLGRKCLRPSTKNDKEKEKKTID